MPNRWNTSVFKRLVLGLVAGVATCGLLFPVIRVLGIKLVAFVVGVFEPSPHVVEIVTQVWDANGYMIWLAWVSASVAIAAEFCPKRSKLCALLLNGSGEALILLFAILLLVQARTAANSIFLQNLAGMLVFATVSLPVLAIWRNAKTTPVRVFDAKSALL
jgi:hypothetical protein